MKQKWATFKGFPLLLSFGQVVQSGGLMWNGDVRNVYMRGFVFVWKLLCSDPTVHKYFTFILFFSLRVRQCRVATVRSFYLNKQQVALKTRLSEDTICSVPYQSHWDLSFTFVSFVKAWWIKTTWKKANKKVAAFALFHNQDYISLPVAEQKYALRKPTSIGHTLFYSVTQIHCFSSIYYALFIMY